jgi:hypothetical protein
VIVVNGQTRGPEFDEIIGRQFSPDGRRIAYVGRRGRKYAVVVDGAEGPPFDLVGGLAFSADSRRFAYAGAVVKRGFGKQKAVGRVVIDGAVGVEHEGMQIGSLLESAMGSTKELLVGYLPELFSEVHGVSSPTFGPDGSRVAHATRRGDDATVVLINETSWAPLPALRASPVFSPDGKRVAVVAVRDERFQLVIDGTAVEAGPAADAGFVSALQFDPESRRVAYVGVVGGSLYDSGWTAKAKRRVYIDGVAGREYNSTFLGRLQFSQDGRRLAYVVGGLPEGQRSVAFAVVDERAGTSYDDIIGRPTFSVDGQSVTYVGQSGRSFYRVAHVLTEAPTR